VFYFTILAIKHVVNISGRLHGDSKNLDRKPIANLIITAQSRPPTGESRNVNMSVSKAQKAKSEKHSVRFPYRVLSGDGQGPPRRPSHVIRVQDLDGP
jgi:hypothetical protein